MLRITLSITVAMMFAATVHAQRPEDRPVPPGGFPQPPGFHLMTALDADKDGKISAKEIENAVAALKELDKNQDGKLSQEEIGWPPSFGGDGRGFPGPGGGPPGFGGQSRPQRPDPDQVGTGATGDSSSNRAQPRTTFFSAEQLKRLDRDKDGKITKDEVPSSVRETIFNRVDTNQDGVIDQNELRKLAVQSSPEPKE